MPDFAAPEFASYVSLCRELRLERTHHRGDYWHNPDWANPLFLLVTYDAFNAKREFQWSPDQGVGNAIWLPQLADWLEMLEVAGARAVTVIAPVWTPYGRRASASTQEMQESAPTREEAVARLFMAVTDKSQGA